MSAETESDSHLLTSIYIYIWLLSCRSLWNVLQFHCQSRKYAGYNVCVRHTYRCMETRIYAIIAFTVRSSKTVTSAFTMSSLSLHCAHPLHVAAVPKLYSHKLHLMYDNTDLSHGYDVMNMNLSQQLLHNYIHIKQGCWSIAVDKVLYRSRKSKMIIDPWRWEMIGCPKTLLRNYSYLLCNSPEERSFQGYFSYKNNAKNVSNSKTSSNSCTALVPILRSEAQTFCGHWNVLVELIDLPLTPR